MRTASPHPAVPLPLFSAERAEGSTHWATLRQLVTDGKVAGPLVHDARIAALCLASSVTELWTLDRDFTRFPALKTRNPLG